MVQVKEMQFATSIGVLFALKEANGFKTLQETYKLFETTSIDNMIDILKVAYNKHNKTDYDINAFIDLLEKEHFGFVLIPNTFQKIVEAIMFDGMSIEEIEETKKKMTITQ